MAHTHEYIPQILQAETSSLAFTTSFSSRRSPTSLAHMWMMEEYLETWFKCSDRDHAVAHIDTSEGKDLRVELFDGGTPYGSVTGKFLRLVPAKTLHMEWELINADNGFRAFIVVDFIPKKDKTHTVIRLQTEEQGPSLNPLFGLLLTSLLRMAGLLRGAGYGDGAGEAKPAAGSAVRNLNRKTTRRLPDRP